MTSQFCYFGQIFVRFFNGSHGTRWEFSIKTRYIQVVKNLGTKLTRSVSNYH